MDHSTTYREHRQITDMIILFGYRGLTTPQHYLPTSQETIIGHIVGSCPNPIAVWADLCRYRRWVIIVQAFEGGSLQGDIYPAVDQQEWQDFLAWRQQGSPTAPHHFQLQTTIGSPHPHPQITSCPIRHRGISTNSPPQSHPNAQIVNFLSPPSDIQVTNRPTLYDNSNNVQGSTSVPVCPGHYRASSHSQPNLSGAQIFSQQSEVLSDDSKERMVPGLGALMNLEARFGQQATESHPVNHAGSHVHLKSHSVPQLPAHVSTALQVQLGASQHGTFQHGTYLAPPQASPSPTGVLSSSSPPPSLPADNVTAKPQQPQPSVPILTVSPSEPHPQGLQTFTPQSCPPSSASSFDSRSSDSTNSDENQQISLQPGSNAVCHADVSSSRTPSGSTPNNTSTPMCNVNYPGSLVLQANNLADGPGLNPSAVLSQHLTQPFSNSDDFADLIPLDHQTNTPLSPKKEKKSFLRFFRQKKQKDGQTSWPDTHFSNVEHFLYQFNQTFSIF